MRSGARPRGVGPIGGILRNPFGLHSSRDEASAPATAAAYDQAEQLRSPPRPWSPRAARRLKRNSRWAEHKAKHTGAARTVNVRRRDVARVHAGPGHAGRPRRQSYKEEAAAARSATSRTGRRRRSPSPCRRRRPPPCRSGLHYSARRLKLRRARSRRPDPKPSFSSRTTLKQPRRCRRRKRRTRPTSPRPTSSYQICRRRRTRRPSAVFDWPCARASSRWWWRRRVGRGFYRPFGEGADDRARPRKSEVRLGFDNEAPAAAALGFGSGRGAINDSAGGAHDSLARFLAAARGVVYKLPAAAAAAAAPFRVDGPGCEVPGGAGAARRGAPAMSPLTSASTHSPRRGDGEKGRPLACSARASLGARRRSGARASRSRVRPRLG